MRLTDAGIAVSGFEAHSPLPLIPVEPIGGAAEPLQVNLVVRGIAARAAGENYMISGVQGVLRDPVIRESSRAAPFRDPGIRISLSVGNLQGHERMRIAEIEIHQPAFDRDTLVFKVCCRERMMRINGKCTKESPGDDQSKYGATHKLP